MKSHASLDAIIDLQHVVSFEENFFLVMIEKVQEGHCVLHMWKIVISSQMSGEDQGPVKFSPDVEYTQDDDEAHSFTHRKGIVDIGHISLGHSFFGNCFPSVILVKDGVLLNN